MLAMNLSLLKLASILVILCVTLLAGLIPFKRRLSPSAARDFPIGEALAAGVFLGAALLHMLGEVSVPGGHGHGHAHGGDEVYPWPFLICGLSFLLLLFLEHLGSEVRHQKVDSNHAITLLTVIILCIHSLLAGAAVGIVSDFSAALILSAAILAHKWAESFALAVQLNKSGLSSNWRIGYFIIFALMTPLGILFGESVTLFHGDTAWPEMIFTALAAGTFLYIGTLHGLNNAPMIKRCCNLREFSFVIIGFLLMALVRVWA